MLFEKTAGGYRLLPTFRPPRRKFKIHEFSPSFGIDIFLLECFIVMISHGVVRIAPLEGLAPFYCQIVIAKVMSMPEAWEREPPAMMSWLAHLTQNSESQNCTAYKPTTRGTHHCKVLLVWGLVKTTVYLTEVHLAARPS